MEPTPPARLAALVRGADRWRHLTVAVLAYALFSSGVIHRYWHPGGHHYADGLVGVLGVNAYVLGCLALLIAVPVRRATRAPSPPGVDLPDSGELVLTSSVSHRTAVPER
jgi:hypothetical protein